MVLFVLRKNIASPAFMMAKECIEKHSHFFRRRSCCHIHPILSALLLVVEVPCYARLLTTRVWPGIPKSTLKISKRQDFHAAHSNTLIVRHRAIFWTCWERTRGSMTNRLTTTLTSTRTTLATWGRSWRREPHAMVFSVRR